MGKSMTETPPEVPNKRGGARPGAGRKSLSGSSGLTERFTTRLTPEQNKTLTRLGGAVWLRDMLDKEAVLEG